MFMLQDEMTKEVATRPLPNLPVRGHVIGRQAIGHLDPRTGLVLLDRLIDRSAYGAEKFGEIWRDRDNCAEFCEETTDAVVYGMQETARIQEGLTALAPDSEQANHALDQLGNAVRYAALADHFAQCAQAQIAGVQVGRK
ncbi:MAG: hypothetical protein J0H98_07255 [Solirubrobacterales bacterium]|nr:hypothetical protein [Solirubrobacterales bacterium]